MLETFREKIESDYLMRRAKNPHFSKRSYAKFIGISHTSLIDFLSGKTSLSSKSAQKIAKSLHFTAEEVELFLKSVKLSLNGISDKDYIHLDDDEFCLISDWIFYGILNLTNVKGHKASPDWIADFFNVKKSHIESALDILLNHGYINIYDNKIIRIEKQLSSTINIPSKALKKHHKQKLQMAIHSIDILPIEARDFSSVTMGISRNKLPMAQKLIYQFKRELSSLLESEDPDDVYTLNIQLLPLKNYSKEACERGENTR